MAGAVVGLQLTLAGSDAPFVDADALARLGAKYGADAERRGAALNRLVARLRAADDRTRLTEINRFFNQAEYRRDEEIAGMADYWQTPLEFLGRFAGDCEDYVIAKYFALRAAGVDDRRLYLTYVKAVRQNIAHMVLSYFETPDSVPLVLDNYDPVVRRATERTDLVPVYSFNAQSLFLARAAGLGQALPADKIKNRNWDQLLRDVERNKL
jgi:predicted transglutaminase-like cysteine proteinase